MRRCGMKDAGEPAITIVQVAMGAGFSKSKCPVLGGEMIIGRALPQVIPDGHPFCGHNSGGSNDFDFGEVFPGLGPFHVEIFEGGDNALCNDVVAEPFVVGGDDVPGGAAGAATIEGVLVGLLELIPIFAHADVVLAELPVLGGILNARKQAFGLFLFADVQEEFQEDDVIVRENFLEGVDLFVARLPDGFGSELEDAHDQNVLVMGTVEDADVAVARKGPVDAPKEIVREFLARRRLEIGGFHAGGIDMLEHAAAGAVLAASVHALQKDNEGMFMIGVQQVLELADFFAKLVGPGASLVLVEAIVPGRIEVAEADFGGDFDGL